MNIKASISFLFFYILCLSCISQRTYTKKDFVSPVRSGFRVLSNFGDIRSNHFHTGIDLRTGEGSFICAIAEGFVSRIKVSPTGFGNAVYIDHPNGLTSVYAHLSSFSKKIDDYVKVLQYKAQDFSIDCYLKPDEIEVCQSEIIGLSGNTGSSNGPHLHFEIRDTKTEYIINPLLYYDVKDNNPPVITQLFIYPTDRNSYINNKNARAIYNVSSFFSKKETSFLKIKGNNNISVSGRIGFGIEAYDTDNYTKRPANIYSIDIIVDSVNIYSSRFEEFSFDDKRAVNSHIDYREFSRNLKNIQRCFVEPNNKTPIYTHLKNQGIVDIADNTIHKIQIIVKDVNGNTANLNFTVTGSAGKKEIKEEKDEYSKVMPFEEVNYFVKEDILISFPEDVFYDTVYFEYNNIQQKGIYSALHQIHNKQTPLNKKMLLSIKADRVPKEYKGKAVISLIGKNGPIASIGGQYKDDFLTAETYDFGNYAIVLDTVPPDIVSLNTKPYEDLTLGKTLRFIIRDNLSGIKKYTAFIDGRWVLFEYDKKNDLITHYFEDPNAYGELHELELFVEDEKGNISNFCLPYYR